MAASTIIRAVLGLGLSVTHALVVRPPIVVFGQASLDVQALTAKLAAKAGHDASIFVTDSKTAQLVQRWMYGVAEGVKGGARVILGTEQLGTALAEARGLCLICDSAPLREGAFELLLDNAPELERVVLLSKSGVTRAKPPGPFGLGGGDASLLENERTIRSVLLERGIELFSIIRAGSLKGGGPGGPQGGFNVGDAELGLSKAYINGIAELETYMTTQAYDQFTVGARCFAGDPIDLPNALVRAANRGSFEARDDETSRTVAAAAVVQALSWSRAVELSVGAAKAETLPTAEEWEAMFVAAGV